MVIEILLHALSHGIMNLMCRAALSFIVAFLTVAASGQIMSACFKSLLAAYKVVHG